MVLIKVDLPRPVCPVRGLGMMRLKSGRVLWSEHTDADDIELEASLQQFLLNLGCDAVETNVAFGEDGLRRVVVRKGGHCD